MKTILIVDDQIELVDYLSMFIEQKGFKVIAAYTGEEGVERYRQSMPCCVFLDLHLPKMDGMGVLEKIKELNPNANVYLCTGDDSLELRQRGEKLGAKGYLLKPLDIRVIVEILDGLEKQGALYHERNKDRFPRFSE